MRPPVGEWQSVFHPEEWTESALCAQTDPDLFFPEPGDHEAARQAKQVCEACPVREQCLESALRHGDQYGIFGGMTASARNKLLKRRRNAEKN